MKTLQVSFHDGYTSLINDIPENEPLTAVIERIERETESTIVSFKMIKGWN